MKSHCSDVFANRRIPASQVGGVSGPRRPWFVSRGGPRDVLTGPPKGGASRYREFCIGGWCAGRGVVGHPVCKRRMGRSGASLWLLGMRHIRRRSPRPCKVSQTLQGFWGDWDWDSKRGAMSWASRLPCCCGSFVSSRSSGLGRARTSNLHWNGFFGFAVVRYTDRGFWFSKEAAAEPTLEGTLML